MALKLGKDGCIYYHATASTALASMTAILTGVSDVSLSMPSDEADITTRGSAGWKNTAPTLKACELTFDMPLDTADAGYIQLRTSWLAGTPLSMCPLTGIKSAAGNEGPDGQWVVTGWERAEPLSDKQMMSVTCKLYSFRAWIATT